MSEEAALEQTAHKLVKRGSRAISIILGLLGAAVIALVFIVVILSLKLGVTEEDLQRQQATLRTQQLILKGETQTVIATLRRNQTSKCEFYNVIGTVPLPSRPFPTRRTVQVVLAARGAYNESACTPTLTPPGAVLKKAAAKYHLDVRPK